MNRYGVYFHTQYSQNSYQMLPEISSWPTIGFEFACEQRVGVLMLFLQPFSMERQGS